MLRDLLIVLVLIGLVACDKDSEDPLTPLPPSKIEYPAYGPEVDVQITGLTFDAMEPFISPDGSTLFFNNLNDGINTRIYYASLVNDSTFTFIGELDGTNLPAGALHLDAVPDLDSQGNFYWTSIREYPSRLDNLFYGKYANGTVRDSGRLQGNFNLNIPGWLVMDHGISYDGQLLYFNNARFDGQNCQGPCETQLGIAQKVNDSTFNVIPNSAKILKEVTDTNYVFYAPYISSDNLELYYTRFPKGGVNQQTVVEILVAVRSNETSSFSVPRVLFSDQVINIVEAPCLTTDKRIMYYHKKVNGVHEIKMRFRL